MRFASRSVVQCLLIAPRATSPQVAATSPSTVTAVVSSSQMAFLKSTSVGSLSTSLNQAPSSKYQVGKERPEPGFAQHSPIRASSSLRPAAVSRVRLSRLRRTISRAASASDAGSRGRTSIPPA